MTFLICSLIDKIGKNIPHISSCGYTQAINCTKTKLVFKVNQTLIITGGGCIALLGGARVVSIARITLKRMWTYRSQWECFVQVRAVDNLCFVLCYRPIKWELIRVYQVTREIRIHWFKECAMKLEVQGHVKFRVTSSSKRICTWLYLLLCCSFVLWLWWENA